MIIIKRKKYCLYNVKINHISKVIAARGFLALSSTLKQRKLYVLNKFTLKANVFLFTEKIHIYPLCDF